MAAAVLAQAVYVSLTIVWDSTLDNAAREAGYDAVNNAYTLAAQRAAAAGGACVRMYAIVFRQKRARIISLPAGAALNDVLQAVTSACNGAHAAILAEAAAPEAITTAATEAAATTPSCGAVDSLLDALKLAADELKMRCYTCSVSAGMIDGNNVICLCTSLSSTGCTIADTSVSSVAVQSKRKRKQIEQEQFDLEGQLRVLARCAVRMHVIEGSNTVNSSSSSNSSSDSAAHVIRLIKDAATLLQVSSDASAELIHARLSQPIAALAAVPVAAPAVATSAAAPAAAPVVAAATTAEAEAAAVTAAVTVAATSPLTSSSAASTTAERCVTPVEAVAATQAERAVTCVKAAETAVAATAAAAAAVAAATATKCAAIRVEAAEVVVLSDSDNADSDDDVMIVDMAPAAKTAVTKAVVKATAKPSIN
eukprot:15729-Heterococcus_DN1.PRE.2